MIWSGAEVGVHVRVVSSVRFQLCGDLRIGANTWIGHQTLIVGGGAEVKIGEQCDIAPRVLIVTGTHLVNYQNSKAAGEGYSLPICISNGCWIGANATILGGTEIGECSIVAAGSVVKGTFPARVLIAGNPARIVKKL